MAVIDILARLRTEGTAQAKDLAKTIEGIDGSAKKGATGLGSLTSGVAAMGVAMGPAIATIGLLGAGLNYSIDQAAEAEQGQAQLAAVLKSTGEAAGLTADEINAINGSLANVTTFGDDAILTGQNLLLTFTNIGEDVFPRATETMLDMATALGTDASGSAIQLGKALNDPIQGITALTRVGVSFTDEQKEMIRTLQESGDIMGAQEIILAELTKEFGGSAQAAAATYTGRITQLKNQMGEAGEAIGKGFLPMLTTLGEKALPVVTDAVENLAVISAEQLEPALADLVETGGDLVAIFGGAEFSSTAVWESLGEEIAGVNEKLLLTQGYIELIRRPRGARWEIITAFSDVGQEAETASERVDGYRAILERLDVQQGLVNDELREGKDAAFAQGNAYDYLIKQTIELNDVTQTTSGAYDSMILVAERTENQMESYGEELALVAEEQAAVDESARQMAEAVGTIVAGAMGESITLTGSLFEATNNLKTAQEELAASPWSVELQEKVATAEGEVTAAFDAMKESHRLMVVDILIQQAGLEGGFTTSQANIMVAMGLMTQAEATMALQSQETARQVGLVGDRLIETFLEDGSISRAEAALLEEAISGVESGAFTADAVLYAMAHNGLGALIGQTQEATTAAGLLEEALQEAEGDYSATFTTNYVTEGAPPPTPGSYSGGGTTPGVPIPQATGGDWLVTQPTLFLAGEAGIPERATFTPLTGGASQINSGGGDTYYINIDARGAAPGVEGDIMRGVEYVMRQHTRVGDGQRRMR